MEEALYHVGLRREQGAGYALLPGDPGRVKAIAGYLEQPRFEAQNREYTTWSGQLGGVRVLVTSTGIGGPSAAIAVEELARIGVHTLIRVGTCGGMQQKVAPGDLVLPTGAVRMEGTSGEYAPLEFPAVPDYAVLRALNEAAVRLDLPHHTGVVHCKDSFYGQHEPEQMPTAPWLQARWEAWKRLGVLASEMETAALFTVSAARGLRAGAVLAAVWNQERDRPALEGAHADAALAIRTAVEAMRILINGDITSCR
jgi:uridine phosphorylase